MTDRDYPARAYTSAVVGTLMIVTFLSLIDRQIPNFLVGPIRHSLLISDTEMSLIQGSSFAIMFSVMGLPLGWLVDRANRRNIIIAGVFLWSIATVYCGFAGTFWQLFLGRVAVGIGEAALAPAVYSLIADYVEPRRRGRILSIYFIGNNLGSGLALIVIGFLVSIGPLMSQSVGLFRSLEPWQVAFILAGLPGIILTPILLFIREVPRRANSGELIRAGAPPATLREFVEHVGSNRLLFACMYGSLSLLAFCNMATYSWAPTHFMRKFGIPADQLGLWLGVTIGCAGLSGAVISAIVTDRLAARDKWGGRFFLSAMSCAIIAPLHLLWPLLQSPLLSFICFGLTGMATSITYASAPAIVQDVVPNRMRGKAVAVHMMAMGLLGYALGPTAVALVTDYVYRDDLLLPYSIATVVPPAALLGLALALIGLKSYSRVRNRLNAADL